MGFGHGDPGDTPVDFVDVNDCGHAGLDCSLVEEKRSSDREGVQRQPLVHGAADPAGGERDSDPVGSGCVEDVTRADVALRLGRHDHGSVRWDHGDRVQFSTFLDLHGGSDHADHVALRLDHHEGCDHAGHVGCFHHVQRLSKLQWAWAQHYLTWALRLSQRPVPSPIEQGADQSL